MNDSTSAATSTLTMENYEQMFKEITRKLYGEGEIDNIVVNYQVLPSTEEVAPAEPMEDPLESPEPLDSLDNHDPLSFDSGIWVSSEEAISWTKSKIASYNSTRKLFRCHDCECVGLLSRIAEHWLGTHANLRVFQCSQCSYTSAWARCVRMHLARQHNMNNEQNSEENLLKENPILVEVSEYLDRLQAKVENDANSDGITIKQEPMIDERTIKIEAVDIESDNVGVEVAIDDGITVAEAMQVTDGISVAEAVPVTVTMPVDSVPVSVDAVPVSVALPVSVSVTMPAELPANLTTEIPTEISAIQSGNTIIIKAPIINAEVIAAATAKRYHCNYCSYATDRRDLYTRHENIHKDNKPFHCYICMKQFSRADHVKKHFVRIHRDLQYNISRIKRDIKPDLSSLFAQVSRDEEMDQSHTEIELHHPQAPQAEPQEIHIQETIDDKSSVLLTIQSPAVKREKSPKVKPEDRKFTCGYCTWTGVGNWCLKRHLNTHIKPYSCNMCEYKAARPERLATHVFKVHNKKACEKCNFLTDDENELTLHVQTEHPDQ